MLCNLVRESDRRVGSGSLAITLWGLLNTDCQRNVGCKQDAIYYIWASVKITLTHSFREYVDIENTKIITFIHEKNWPSIQVCFLGAPPALPFISA